MLATAWRRLALLASLSVLQSACAASGGELVRLEAASSLAEASVHRPLTSVFRGELTSDDPRFGGLSGIDLDPDGSTLWLVGDRGTVWQARLQMGEGGRVDHLANWQATELSRHQAQAKSMDAEALVVRDENIAVAFEGDHRVNLLERSPFENPEQKPRVVWRAPDDAPLSSNGGIEALSDLPDGGLIAIGEEVNRDGLAPVWVFGAGDPREGTYRPAPGFSPTGADRLGTMLVIVERSLSLLGGWQARLTCVAVPPVDGEVAFRPVELARFSADDDVDNLEAVTLLRRGEDVHLFLVSDDNFSGLQKTVLLQFRVKSLDLAAAGCL
ncbi:MAG: esterase-like activity of phytase family protein [Geminicoccaceae bacterium]